MIATFAQIANLAQVANLAQMANLVQIANERHISFFKICIWVNSPIFAQIANFAQIAVACRILPAGQLPAGNIPNYPRTFTCRKVAR